MPILVHLTAEKNVKRILQSGIHKGKSGVYCLPVLPNYFISHQWLRELKRGGQRTFVGIYFNVLDDEMVWFGHYGKPHTNITEEPHADARSAATARRRARPHVLPQRPFPIPSPATLLLMRELLEVD